MPGDGSWILLLEGGLALALLVFIVWWTLPKPPRSPGPTVDQADPGQEKGVVSPETKPPER